MSIDFGDGFIEQIVIDARGGDDTIIDPGSGVTILGGEGNDTIFITATGGDGIVVDGGGGDDSVTIYLGNLQGEANVTSSGAGGSTSADRSSPRLETTRSPS